LLVGFASWRWVFGLVVPFALAAAMVLPPDRTPSRRGGAGIDYAGAALITLGLGALTMALIAWPRRGFGDPMVFGGIVAALVLLAVMILVERRVSRPLLDPAAFRSAQFTGANLFTLLVYGALGVTMFLLMLVLQNVMGYSAVAAGCSLLPVNVLLFLLSARAGRLAGKIGSRAPMAAGALLAGAGCALFGRL